MPELRVAVLTGNPLHSNPRVVKEAAALTEAGHEVIVHGAWSTEQGVETDRNLAEQGGYAFVPLLPPDTPEGKLHRLLQRAARKVVPWSRWTFGLVPVTLEREAIRLRPHLSIAHSEPALFAALALRKRGVRVGVDMEDWFSEDLPPESRRHRPVALLRKAERELLRCAAYATCTTEAMADALARAYGCPRPTRIYNVFPKPVLPDHLMLRDRSPASKSLDGAASRGRAVRSIHWFSQTIGPGRGLEDLFAAAESLPEECEIHLRGNPGGYRRWIESAVPLALRSRVFVHAPVPNDELPERIAEHDIGFAGETTAIRSRDLTATNKIFQYLQSGLAVVASDTAGQREVASLAGDGVHLFRADDVEDLATKLGELTGNAALLREGRERAWAAAKELCWENEQQRFLDVVRRALPGSAE
jgi:glycosyltransferase involved in cell wall biosynthesis